MEFCQEHGLHLIVDEIYALTDLNTPPSKAPAFVSALSLTEPLVPSGAVKVDPSRVHVVWSASKLFGMSGFRVVSTVTFTIYPFHYRRANSSGLHHNSTKPSAHHFALPTNIPPRQRHIITLPLLTPNMVSTPYLAQTQLGALNRFVPPTRRLPDQARH
jgi:ABC-type Fe3+ transport system permease subunit